MTQPAASLASRARRGLVRVVPLASRIQDLGATVAAQQREIGRLTARVEAHRERLDRQRDRLEDFRQRFVPFEKASNLRALEHGRQGHQVGAIEQRLGALEERMADGVLVSDTEAEAEARRLIDEIRREHEQIRVRMQIVSAYEERLRRVEATLGEVYDGDPRHLV
jgi:uncharacterized coiled-coil protein SlyX